MFKRSLLLSVVLLGAPMMQAGDNQSVNIADAAAASAPFWAPLASFAQEVVSTATYRSVGQSFKEAQGFKNSCQALVSSKPAVTGALLTFLTACGLGYIVYKYVSKYAQNTEKA